MNEIIKKLQESEIKKVFFQNDINHLYLIGSFARKEETDKSDIDLLYSLKENTNFWLFSLLKLKNFLENKLWRKVDLVEKDSINKHLREFVEKDKRSIF